MAVVLIKILRIYLRPYSLLLWAVVVFQIIQTMANLYLPRLYADIIDRGVAQGNVHRIWTTGLWMLLMSLVQVAATACALYFGSKTAARFGRDLRAAIFHRIGTFSAREVGHFGAPTLITRNTNDVQQVQLVAMTGASMLVAAPISVVGGVFMALQEDAQLSWLFLACIPFMMGALGLIISRQIPKYRAMQQRIDVINRVLREQLAGIRVVRAFVREPFEIKRFAAANSDITATALSVGRIIAWMFPVIMLVLNASTILVLWFGANRIESGHLQVGELVAFVSYLMQILMSVMFATFMASMIPRASVCAERIGEVLKTESSVISPQDPIEKSSIKGSVEFRNAGFQYPGAIDPVLNDISFSTQAGKTTAIIGSTGAGKTTLVNSIPRLYDVTSGEVLIDGVDVRQLSPSVISEVIGIVPQQPYLFSGTIATNLRYGKPSASDDDLWNALRIAQAEEFVREMPEGLDSPISQGGTTVSGGQRQRLAIARALVHQPEIYLFDDSFSALDMATDARLRMALRANIKDAAIIIVAQRVSTIRYADQIIVLDAGVITGIGTHDDLLKGCPTYREIVESQRTIEEAS